MEPDQGAKVFAKIVVGVLIGFVAGFVNARGQLWSKKTETVSETLLFLLVWHLSDRLSRSVPSLVLWR